MSGSPKEKLATAAATEAGTEGAHEDTRDERELYLRDGRKLVVADHGADQLVEIRSESGLLELRIRLTEDGPVLQMESVRMQLKAAEAVEIHSKRVEVVGSEQVAVAGKDVEIRAEEDVDVEAKNDVRVVGAMIYLN